jgi:hypothetical protein
MAEQKQKQIVQPPLPFMIAAGIGIGAAVLTMFAWRGEKAKKLYLSHCDVALANPRFSSPDLAKLDLKAKTFDGSAEEFERYEWYVARLVYTLDECVALAPIPQWYAVERTQLANHKKYFASDYYKKQDYLSHYSLRMRMLIEQQAEAA